NNPFTDRICYIFSSDNDDRWSFEDFLDMVSVFSEGTPPEKKAEYAFCIYGKSLLSHRIDPCTVATN
ncbi:hypothetical protein TNIN_157891, partial [Trichonephila inaurata madagascariensis]